MLGAIFEAYYYYFDIDPIICFYGNKQYKARPITVTEATHWLVLMDMKTSRTIPFEGKRYAIILMSLKSMTMMRKEARAPI